MAAHDPDLAAQVREAEAALLAADDDAVLIAKAARALRAAWQKASRAYERRHDLAHLGPEDRAPDQEDSPGIEQLGGQLLQEVDQEARPPKWVQRCPGCDVLEFNRGWVPPTEGRCDLCGAPANGKPVEVVGVQANCCDNSQMCEEIAR